MRLLLTCLLVLQANGLAAEDSSERFLDATLDAISTAAANLRTGEMDFDYRSTANTFNKQRQRPASRNAASSASSCGRTTRGTRTTPSMRSIRTHQAKQTKKSSVRRGTVRRR